MARWPIEDRGLDELELDLRNVRIPSGDLDESAIADYLVEAEDLFGLAQEILRDGYLDNELPVVAIETGRCIVLEGNRRVTALKAIHNPALLGKSAARMDRLLSRYPESDTPTEIRVMIAPSREAAQGLLARLHTHNPKKSWLREQQAVFYHAQLSPAVTVDDVRAKYPAETPSSLAGFIRMGEMREVIRSLHYDDHELEQYVMKSQLKMTVFEYAYERPKIQDALGLAFDKDGLLKSKRMRAGQRRGLIYLLERFQMKTLNTRAPELIARNPNHEAFAEQLRRIVAGETADSANAGGETADDVSPTSQPTSSAQPGGTGGAEKDHAGSSGGTTARSDAKAGQAQATAGREAESAGAGQAGSRGANRGDTLSRLNMDGFEYRGSSGGLRRRFEELKRLDVRDFPNAAYDLLRTVLECAIKDHFFAKWQKRLTGKMLGACITELAQAYQNDQRLTTLINAVNRKGSMPAAQFTGTAFSLNASNHEPDAFVIGKDVHEAWERIKPILIEIVGT